ncbi:MAG: hypothetical protein JSU63_18025 [Phycisphaerales bacterium]|nr:MAG: hypothetical protein JSU63_18025 [Phycisphaerales bacterium]
MIRKIIIVVLLLGTVGAAFLWGIGYVNGWDVCDNSFWTIIGLPATEGWNVIFWARREMLEVLCTAYVSNGEVMLTQYPSWEMVRLPQLQLQFLGFRLESRWRPTGLAMAVIPLWMPFTLFATYPGIALIRGRLRRWQRRRKGLCVSCGYNLTGNESGVCPECGCATESNNRGTPYLKRNAHRVA